MKKIVWLLGLITLLSGCSLLPAGPMKDDSPGSLQVEEEQTSLKDLINISGETLEERVKVPPGYERLPVEEGTFAHYLRSLPLKPHGSKVRYYNGTIKQRDVYAAVVDFDIGDKDLQQCADAVIRLRAEYLYGQEQYEKIHFNFTNGFKAEYGRWRQGYRVAVQGNTVKWVKTAVPADDYQSFRKYLDLVFSYAGTLSLAQELIPVDLNEIKIGDVFIQGGSPGHCVIVVDLAEHPGTGEKIFLLAQSYMPAQDIHILKNPANQAISPWYSLNFGDVLQTAEWNFAKDDLRRFAE